MKKIDIICVGKLKEKFFQEAINEYSKRLKSYCKFNIIEVSDEKIPDKASFKEELKVKDKEADKILSKIPENAFVIALVIEGKMLSSQELTQLMQTTALNGTSHIVFVIGGSLGLDEKVISRANYKLSFSKMTFPHQLFRIMLIEQIYRAYKIHSNEVYHK